MVEKNESVSVWVFFLCEWVLEWNEAYSSSWGGGGVRGRVCGGRGVVVVNGVVLWATCLIFVLILLGKKIYWENGLGFLLTACNWLVKCCCLVNTVDKFVRDSVTSTLILSPVEYFLDACTIKSALSVHAQCFIKSLACLVQEKFLIASLKPLTNSKNCSVSRIKFLCPLFFQCTFISGFRKKFQDHRIWNNFFRDTGGYQKAGTSFQKRVTGLIVRTDLRKKYSSRDTIPLSRRKRK